LEPNSESTFTPCRARLQHDCQCVCACLFWIYRRLCRWALRFSESWSRGSAMESCCPLDEMCCSNELGSRFVPTEQQPRHLPISVDVTAKAKGAQFELGKIHPRNTEHLCQPRHEVGTSFSRGTVIRQFALCSIIRTYRSTWISQSQIRDTANEIIGYRAQTF
jgi:hypothetical protein